MGRLKPDMFQAIRVGAGHSRPMSDLGQIEDCISKVRSGLDMPHPSHEQPYPTTPKPIQPLIESDNDSPIPHEGVDPPNFEVSSV